MEKTSILYADDEKVFHVLVGSILDDEVFDVDYADNGLEAFEKAINKALIKPYDIILMDISMPILSGDESANKIKYILPDQYIIAMTAYEINEFDFSSFNNYFRKPITVRTLGIDLLKIIDGIKRKSQ